MEFKKTLLPSRGGERWFEMIEFQNHVIIFCDDVVGLNEKEHLTIELSHSGRRHLIGLLKSL